MPSNRSEWNRVNAMLSAMMAGVVSREQVQDELGVGIVDGIMLKPGESYEALPSACPDRIECEYCGCNVEPSPTCSQCNAPLNRRAATRQAVARSMISWRV